MKPIFIFILCCLITITSVYGENDLITLKVFPHPPSDEQKAALTEYRVSLIRHIRRHWQPGKDDRPGIPITEFSIFANGKICDIKLCKSSGKNYCDNLAIAAIRDSSPAPTLPKDIKKIQVRLKFDPWRFMNLNLED